MDEIGAAVKKEERGREKGERGRGSRKERVRMRWLQEEGEFAVKRERERDSRKRSAVTRETEERGIECRRREGLVASGKDLRR